ncbi:MAG: aldo/keto reductase [Bacteroidota bacterium]
MNKQPLHPQGPSLSRIIAGAWRWNQLNVHQLNALINQAIDMGITTFDHADIYGDYGNESAFGEALKLSPGLQSKLQIVTKCGIKLLSAAKPAHSIKHYDTSFDHIVTSAENSIRQLCVEKIDLLLLHRPDPLMDVDKVAEAFTQLKEQGKVLHFGVSNFTPAQFDLLQGALPFPLVTNQIELSLFHHQPIFNGTIDHLYKHRVAPMAWSPLGGGKPFVDGHQVGERVQKLATALQQKYQATLPQLLLGWLLAHPSNVFPVAGTSQASRLKEAADAMHVKLERQDWFEMLRWVTGTDVP